jgi:phosphate transport system permease protein
LLSKRASRLRRLAALLGHGTLLLITSSSALAVLFIFFFIARDAIPFFFTGEASVWARMGEFFAGRAWYPSHEPPSFGALSIFVGSGLVTAGAILVAVPLGVSAAVCLSDILPFTLRQVVKPVIEVLAAIPSVAYGFFALVIFAPLLQNDGGRVLTIGWWCLATPVALLAVFVLSDVFAAHMMSGGRGVIRASLAVILFVPAVALLHQHLTFWWWSLSIPLAGIASFVVGELLATVAGSQRQGAIRVALAVIMLAAAALGLPYVGGRLSVIEVSSGANALNVSIILGIMALPTVVSVSEDALQAVGRDLREGSYALGSTRAETLVRVVIPAASSGICAAVILGVMRAIGETMVVWMASGNAAQIPQPFYNLLEPVRTLTATIAGDMGEADHVTGSSRYHVLFAMALALLSISLICNLISERVIGRGGSRHG